VGWGGREKEVLRGGFTVVKMQSIKTDRHDTVIRISWKGRSDEEEGKMLIPHSSIQRFIPGNEESILHLI